MSRPTYIQRQRRRWAVPAARTRADYPTYRAPRVALGATDEPQRPEDIVISSYDMQAAALKSPDPWSFKAAAASGDMKALAKALYKDRDLLRKAWPQTEHCMTLGAYDRVVTPVFQLTNAVIKLANNMGDAGLRVSAPYYSIGRELSAEGSNPYWGIAHLIALRDKWKTKYAGRDPEDIVVCVSGKPGYEYTSDVRGRILYMLGRIAIALEGLAYLEEIRPWFVESDVLAFLTEAFEVLFDFGWAIGSKLTKWTGVTVDVIDDLFAATAKSVSWMRKLIDWAPWIGLGYVAYLLFKKPKKKKGATSA